MENAECLSTKRRAEGFKNNRVRYATETGAGYLYNVSIAAAPYDTSTAPPSFRIMRQPTPRARSQQQQRANGGDRVSAMGPRLILRQAP